MKIISSPAQAARWSRRAPRPLVLVPTMGALHAGHLALLVRARKLAGARGSIAVSIFVNPTQFAPGEDYRSYPRPFRRDAALCREHGADLIFHPSAAQMYAGNFSSAVVETALSAVLCGKSRPGHFRGVGTVVCKLLNVLAPDAAVFGEKDYQQLCIIRRLVRDLNLGAKIVGVPIVRESDGLALSSRNQHLTPSEREQAPLLYAALRSAARSRGTPREMRAAAIRAIAKAPLAKIDYVEVVDAETLRPIKKATAKMRIAAAVFFGNTRLIDNLAAG